jgi:exonuclease III
VRRIETQNVRGFTPESRRKWIGAWRRTPAAERPLVWLIQETHVSDREDAEQLDQEWTRAWGKHKQTNGPTLSYWSVHTEKSGGVAVLVNPSVAATVTPWQQERWSNRVIAVKVGDIIVVDIYAPNRKQEREKFFADLRAWPWEDSHIILAGDFNSVQSPVLDRMGRGRSARPESEELQKLTQQLQLEDARTLEETADDDADSVDPTEFYTWWGPNAASRIDRFYVPLHWTSTVQWVLVEEPAAQSDHQKVQMHFLGETSRSRAKRRRRGVTYPIKTAHPDKIHQKLMQELVEAGVGRNTSTTSWDETTIECVQCIHRVAEEEAQRRRGLVRKIKAQNRAHLMTRRELLEENIADQQDEYLVRMGQRLERTRDQLRWSFKRVSNWEQDQTITEIHQLHGKKFTRGMSIANRFKSEWQSILGQTHNEYAQPELEQKIDKFVEIPESRKISQQQNDSLMCEITEDEVIEAVTALNRNKAAGADGLNNDFFKDAQSLLVPIMVTIGNEMLKGGEPPLSFLEGLIIPLRKKGDSADAMDFRPISLLQTGYKVYTKVIATRAQRVLGRQ